MMNLYQSTTIRKILDKLKEIEMLQNGLEKILTHNR
jgi:hypothetical protein